LGFSPCNLTGSNPLFDTDLLILMAVIRLLAGCGNAAPDEQQRQ
jgi:hypothetical protein